jgi:DNA-binding MarR family transcriptional regulator
MKDQPDALTIKDLVSYRLHKAAFHATKHAYLAYARRFGITGGEWRLIGILHTDGPISLARLAEEVDIQLAQASRMMSALIRRGLAQGRSDEKDGRSVTLSLTTEGEALYHQVFAEARARHEALLSVLTRTERAHLFQALQKLTDKGRAMLEEARQLR